MTSLYDQLGSTPDASADELRQAYRRAARQVHPDVNPDPAAEAAIRRLNEAWAVLGDPDRRRRYDAEIGLSADSTAEPGPPRPAPPRAEPGDGWTPAHPRSRLLRPSFVVVGILAIIFVVTAYAGSSDHPKAPTTPAPPTTVSTASFIQGSPTAPQAAIGGDGSGRSGANLVGKCILRLLGYDAIVLCSEHGAQMIAAEVTTTADCPAGTTGYQLEGHSQLVCLTSTSS